MSYECRVKASLFDDKDYFVMFAKADKSMKRWAVVQLIKLLQVFVLM